MNKKWEYKILEIIRIGVDKTPILNMHGKDGWELVAVGVDQPSHFLYFKREATKGN